MDEDKRLMICTVCATVSLAVVAIAITIAVYASSVHWNEGILKGGYSQDVNGRWVKQKNDCGNTGKLVDETGSGKAFSMPPAFIVPNTGKN